MLLQDKIFKLKGKVQNYAWGGFEYIPHWLGVENKEHKPFAEYWMGAHPSASSVLEVNGKDEALKTLIDDSPEDFLSEATIDKFNELPYLFKILDVKDMLSIQVHPTKEEAEKGYAAEDAAGVPLNAPNRNYKDKNHKPEVMVALGDFWLLHGFKTKEKLLATLQGEPEFSGYDAIFTQNGYKGLYKHVMEMPQTEVNALLKPLVNRELTKKANNELMKPQPGWWVAKLYEDGNVPDDLDRGIFSIYFFNIMNVDAGDAVFQGAGVPHAYMEGQNVELMANSDNVLRGGLTPKHVDVPELMKHTVFEGIEPKVLKGERLPSGEKLYDCPVPDFGITQISIKAGETVTGKAASTEIIVVLKGTMTVKEGGTVLHLNKGEAAAILPGVAYTISTDYELTAYKAFVPEQ